MNRSLYWLTAASRPLAMAVCVVLTASAAPASAGWLSELGEIAGAAGKAGGEAAETAAGLERASQIITHLPAAAQKGAVAAEALPDGAWRFRNVAGDTITATSPEGIKGALSGLALDGDQLSIYVSEDAAFAAPAAFDTFPDAARLHLLIGDKAYPLLRTGKGEAAKLYTELNGDIVVALTDRQLFTDALWQLQRPLGKSGIRVASLDTVGPASLPAAGMRTVDGLPQAETLNAGGFGIGLASIRGQTLVVTGNIEGGLLHFVGNSGGESSIAVNDLMRAAEQQDVNLVLLDAGTPKQPGGTTWLLQERGVAHLDAAMAKATLGDFVGALAKGQGRLEVATDWGAGGHFRLTAAPVGASAPAASGEVAETGLGEHALAFSGELARSLAGHVVPRAATMSLNSVDRQWDLDSRLIPGIPAALQFVCAFDWLAGLIGYTVARSWWRFVTRTSAAALSWPWRVAYEIGYWLVFTPLVGPLALLGLGLVSVLGQLLAVWRLITWPFRRKQASA